MTQLTKNTCALLHLLLQTSRLGSIPVRGQLWHECFDTKPLHASPLGRPTMPPLRRPQLKPAADTDHSATASYRCHYETMPYKQMLYTTVDIIYTPK